jgi:hypothetical protein
LAQVQADLPILLTISTKAAYPESAFLPQPEENKPNPTVPVAPGLTPTTKSADPAPPKSQP